MRGPLQALSSCPHQVDNAYHPIASQLPSRSIGLMALNVPAFPNSESSARRVLLHAA